MTWYTINPLVLIFGSNLNGTYVLQHRLKIHIHARMHPHYIVATHSKRVPNQTCHTVVSRGKDSGTISFELHRAPV